MNEQNSVATFSLEGGHLSIKKKRRKKNKKEGAARICVDSPYMMMMMMMILVYFKSASWITTRTEAPASICGPCHF